MLKKLLILPLLSVLGIGAFASASDITVSCVGTSCTPTNSITVSDGLDNYLDNYTLNYSCTVADNVDPGTVPIRLEVSYLFPGNSVSSANYQLTCTNSSVNLQFNNEDFPINSILIKSPSDTPFDFTFIDISPDTPDTPDNSDSSFFPFIPSSFTSGLTSLISNFGGIIVDWLPTIILLSLGITAIFALFRVVRNYARSSFNG